MEMHGSIVKNLKMAVESSRRLRGHAIHADTRQFWADLVAEARAARASGDVEPDPELDAYIAEIEVVLAEHAA